MIAKSILRSPRQISLWLMIAFYLAGGINHFKMPDLYETMVPDYMGNASLLNILSGIAEIVLAIGLIIKPTRRWAAYGIVAMLIAFIPAHVWMITEGDSLGLGGMKIPAWIAWVRLIVIHPILLYWAWFHRNS